jgi:hypothetical protein
MKNEKEIEIGNLVQVSNAGSYVVEEFDGPNWVWLSDGDGEEHYIHIDRIDG